MSINIHGKEYITVAERVAEAHKDKNLVSIETEVLSHSPRVVVKAKVVLRKEGGGREHVFTGISAANETKAIEKVSPYEVAETSAVGRALAFAGYAGTEIASYDEMVKAGAVKPKKSREYVEPTEPPFGDDDNNPVSPNFKI